MSDRKQKPPPFSRPWADVTDEARLGGIVGRSARPTPSASDQQWQWPALGGDALSDLLPRLSLDDSQTDLLIEALAGSGDFSALSLDSLLSVRSRLRIIAGSVQLANGIIGLSRPSRPSDPGLTPSQLLASQILHSSLLDEIIEQKRQESEGALAESSEKLAWQLLCDELIQEMDRQIELPDPTQGSDELSQKTLAREAREILQRTSQTIEDVLLQFGGELSRQDRTDTARHLYHLALELVLAGVSAHSAATKGWEPTIVAARRSRQGAKAGRLSAVGNPEELREYRHAVLAIYAYWLKVRGGNQKAARGKVRETIFISETTVRNFVEAASGKLPPTPHPDHLAEHMAIVERYFERHPSQRRLKKV